MTFAWTAIDRRRVQDRFLVKIAALGQAVADLHATARSDW